MSVSRVKSDAKCSIGPLPDNLPKPANLRAGLQTVRILFCGNWLIISPCLIHPYPYPPISNKILSRSSGEEIGKGIGTKEKIA